MLSRAIDTGAAHKDTLRFPIPIGRALIYTLILFFASAIDWLRGQSSTRRDCSELSVQAKGAPDGSSTDGSGGYCREGWVGMEREGGGTDGGGGVCERLILTSHAMAPFPPLLWYVLRTI